MKLFPFLLRRAGHDYHAQSNAVWQTQQRAADTLPEERRYHGRLDCSGFQTAPCQIDGLEETTLTKSTGGQTQDAIYRTTRAPRARAEARP